MVASRIYYGIALFGVLIFLIVFDVHYQSFMTNLMYEKQVDSVAEIIEKNYTLAGDSLVLNHLNKRNEV